MKLPLGATGGAKWATGAPAGGAHTKCYATELDPFLSLLSATLQEAIRNRELTACN